MSLLFGFDTAFYSCRFVQHLFWRLGFGWTKWLSAFSKTVLKFVAVTSFLFLVHSIFLAVGLDNDFKPLLFSPTSARTFFVSRFNFIPQLKVVLFLLLLLVDTMTVCFFQFSVFKIKPGFALLAFFVAVLV